MPSVSTHQYARTQATYAQATYAQATLTYALCQHTPVRANSSYIKGLQRVGRADDTFSPSAPPFVPSLLAPTQTISNFLLTYIHAYINTDIEDKETITPSGSTTVLGTLYQIFFLN